MKINRSAAHLALILAAIAAAEAAPVVRNDTAGNLNTIGAWVGGVAPVAADVATWDASSALTNTLGANLTWGGLDLTNSAGPVSVSGANALTLDNATDANTVFNAGANGFTWGVAGTGGNFNIVGALATVAPGYGNTGTGATFAGSGTVTISSTGTKNWSTSGNATSGANGVTNVTFTGTLALRGATIPAAGSLPPGNWLALGGGGGAASNAGTTTQTGSFALDTGDATSCGAFIVTQGWSGQFLKLNSLGGTGSIRADWGLNAGTQTRGIELDQAGDTTLSGSILVHNGSSQRRNVTIVKKGAGTLTLTGALGSSQTTGGLPASLNFEIQNGAIQLGDGTTNIIYQNAANWDPASTFVVGSGATLRIKTASAFTWTRALTGGTGTVELTTDGDPGDGAVTFTANHSGFAGNLNLNAGSLRMGPNLGSGILTVKSGTVIMPGLPAANGTSVVGGLVLENNTDSDFRMGVTSDRIEITAADGLTVPGTGGIHTVNLYNQPSAGGTITLIDYTGAALTTEQFGRLVLGSLPSGSATYQLINNTANTSVDLQVTLEDQIWKASTDGNWDGATTNWALASTPGTPAAFSLGHPVLFDDSAAIFAVAVDAAGMPPLSTTFDNSLNAYTLTGGEIYGTSALVKKGTNTVTLSQSNSYSGGTTVNAGTLVFDGAANTSSGGVTINAGKLRIGSGGATGDIGAGAVTVATGATLEFDRSNAVSGTADLDYKTQVKMRNVSGAGDIVLTGGLLLFNYTGAGTGFAEAGSWANFTGNLTIRGGSEFQTIRNGATAMGSGDIILGDATTGGSLSQIEGNWTWTNDIILVGGDNRIRNRSLNGPRSLKIQGVVSGAGGLTFEDPAVSMTDPNRGFILTNANTLTGTLTLAAGVPLRVGGIPGNVDASNPGLPAGAFGTLGAATVVNHGTLTFSRTDAHTVANPISGTGALRVGIPVGLGLGDTGTQVLTFTGTASHTGATTVNNGTLVIDATGSMGGSEVNVAAAATLAGTGTVAAPLIAAGTVAPGPGLGELKVTGNTDLSGTLDIGVDGTAADRLTVTGDLDLDGVTLTIQPTGAGFTQPSYVIASCTGALSGTPVVPQGYSVALQGGQVVLSQGNDYDSWLAGFTFAPGADTTPGGDPDGDGMSNRQEYAFGLNPTSGASVNPITVALDKASGGFTYRRRKPSLTNLTYTIWTSTDLITWTQDTGAEESATDSGDNQSVAVILGVAPAPSLFVRVKAVE